MDDDTYSLSYALEKIAGIKYTYMDLLTNQWHKISCGG